MTLQTEFNPPLSIMLLQTANVSASKTKRYIPIRKMSFLKSVPSTCKLQLLFTSNLFTLKKILVN